MKRHRNPKFDDIHRARAAAIAMSRREGRLYVAKSTSPGSGHYHVVPVALPNRRKLRKSKAPKKSPAYWKALRAATKKNPLFGPSRKGWKFLEKTGQPGAKFRAKVRAERAAKLRAERAAKKKGGFFGNRKKGPYKSWREKRLGMDAFKRAERRAFAGYMRGGAPRRRNPDESFIGRAPTLAVRGSGDMYFPRGVLRKGPDGQSVRLDLGGAPAPRPGSSVTRIDYDDPVKAMDAYKEIARFRHDCREPFIVSPAKDGSILLTSKSTAWRIE